MDEDFPTVPGYRVLGLTGAGGTASVWQAVEESSGDAVAIKVPRPGAGVGALQREAAVLSAVRVAGLVAVRAVTVLPDGRPALVTDLASAGSLAAVVARDGVLAPAVVARIAVDVASTLAALHADGVLHGDVSPGNILWQDPGPALLSDLGSARLLAERPAREDAGPGTGAPGAPGAPPAARTPGFAGPECRGGPAGDVYGVAASAWWALTGRIPDGPEPAGRRAWWRRPVDDPAAAALAALREALRAGMHPDTRLRLSAADLAAELARVAAEPGLSWSASRVAVADPVPSQEPVWAPPPAPPPGQPPATEAAGPPDAPDTGRPAEERPRPVDPLPPTLMSAATRRRRNARQEAAAAATAPPGVAGIGAPWSLGAARGWFARRMRGSAGAPDVADRPSAGTPLVPADGGRSAAVGEQSPSPAGRRRARGGRGASRRGARPRALVAVAGSAALVGLAFAAWASVRPEARVAAPGRAEARPSQAAASRPAAAPPGSGAPDWRAVLAGLDEQRVRAFTDLDAAALLGADAPASPALAEDESRLAALTSRGVHAVSLRPALASVTALEPAPDGRPRLRVVDRLPAYQLAGGDGRVVATQPGRGESAWLVTLAPAGASWRVWSVASG